MHMLIAKFIERGLRVLTPLCEDSSYDLVVHHAERFYRVQVKRASVYRGTSTYTIPFRQITGFRGGSWRLYKYSEAHTDFVVGVIVPTGDFYAFPVKIVAKYKAGILVNPQTPVKSRTLDSELYRNRITFGGDEFEW